MVEQNQEKQEAGSDKKLETFEKPKSSPEDIKEALIEISKIANNLDVSQEDLDAFEALNADEETQKVVGNYYKIPLQDREATFELIKALTAGDDEKIKATLRDSSENNTIH